MDIDAVVGRSKYWTSDGCYSTDSLAPVSWTPIFPDLSIGFSSITRSQKQGNSFFSIRSFA